jgi:hypothetical protein
MTTDMIDIIADHTANVTRELTAIEAVIRAGNLAPSDRHYLDRCTDLLRIELSALTEYVRALA